MSVSDGAASDGSVLYSHSDQSSDVLGRAFRVFNRSQIPLSGIAYELRARDVVQGWACGSGGVLYVMDFAVTDPAATWPDARSGPTPAFGEGVPDDGGGYVTVRGAGSFLAPTSVMTLVLLHADNSNICTIDVFWDSLLLTPIP